MNRSPPGLSLSLARCWHMHASRFPLDPEYLQMTQPLGQLIYKPQAQLFYKQREKFSHKGAYGHALIIGGSKGKIGAVTLSAKAALKTGAGLVTAYVPNCGNDILQVSVPEVMTISDASETFISSIKYEFEPSAIAIGMGLGQHAATSEALKKLFSEVKIPMVIDADALNCISKHSELLASIPENSILTPHEGELKRLVGEWKNDYEKLEKAKAFSKKHTVIVVIKGAHTITVNGDQLYINTTGNPGMATAGSGDVLSGMIAGLMAQDYNPLLATIFGVYLHGTAGNITANEEGFVKMPNVNTMLEIMDIREAQRSYEANLGMIEQSRTMISRTIDLLRSV